MLDSVKLFSRKIFVKYIAITFNNKKEFIKLSIDKKRIILGVSD